MKKASPFLAVLLCFVLVLTSCTAAWVTQAEQIIVAVVPAITNILALVAAFEGKTISANDVATINRYAAEAQQDLQLVDSLLQQYQSAQAAAQPGILGQIDTAILTAQANLGSIMPAIHIQDQATQQKVTAIVGLVLAEVGSLAVIIPLVKSGQVAKARMKAHAVMAPKNFHKAFNAALLAKTGNPRVDAVAPIYVLK